MIRFSHEKLDYFMQFELIPMFDEHYRELTLNKEHVKLKPRWDVYHLLQKSGNFVALLARDDEDRIVGYSAFFVDRHMHYADIVFALNDVFYLHPDIREGATALRFVRFTEKFFADFMAEKYPGLHYKVVYHYKAANNFGPILHRLGYSPEEGVAAKLF